MKAAFFIGLANKLPNNKYFNSIRHRIYELAGMNIKGRCSVWGPLMIRPSSGVRNIEIGENTFLNTEIRFGVPFDKVKIGCSVLIGPRVMFETVSHNLVHVPGKGRGASSRAIIVEDEVWLGAGVIVTQGVVIGQGSVVAAGAVVVSDIEPYCLYGGVPARLIRKLEKKDLDKVPG